MQAALIAIGQTIKRQVGTQDALASATRIDANGIRKAFGQVALRASVSCSSTRRRSATLLGMSERRMSSRNRTIGMLNRSIMAAMVTNFRSGGLFVLTA